MTDSAAMSWLTKTRPGAAKPDAPGGAPLPPGDDDTDTYKAWGKGHPDTTLFDVRLRPDSGGSAQGEVLPLHYLLRVTYSDTPMGDAVTFAFADCIITARGRNLKGLRTALLGGKVDFIQQHDAVRWPAVPAGEPVILDIEVIAPGRSRPV